MFHSRIIIHFPPDGSLVGLLFSTEGLLFTATPLATICYVAAENVQHFVPMKI